MFQPLTNFVQRSAIFVLLILTIGAVVAFAGVNHLARRFVANEQARGRRLYVQGTADLNAGRADLAIEELRAALTCDRHNSQYQLTLGRALRDTGRLDEAQSYLESLWVRTPEDGTINLALGRVEAQRGSVEGALRYYHNAMYGVWASDADGNRRKARLELIEFLLQKHALDQARSELVALAASLPPHPALRERTADLLAQAQDYPDALSEYEQVLHLDRGNEAALAGAGQAAYRAGRYRTAQRYLERATTANPQDTNLHDLYASASLILQTDPFLRRISDAERNRRIASAYEVAGKRLSDCAGQRGVDLESKKQSPGGNTLESPLSALQERWIAARRDLPRLRSAAESDLPDILMDLVFDIEQETANECGEPHGADMALLLISRDRETVDQ